MVNWCKLMSKICAFVLRSMCFLLCFNFVYSLCMGTQSTQNNTKLVPVFSRQSKFSRTIPSVARHLQFPIKIHFSQAILPRYQVSTKKHSYELKDGYLNQNLLGSNQSASFVFHLPEKMRVNEFKNNYGKAIISEKKRNLIVKSADSRGLEKRNFSESHSTKPSFQFLDDYSETLINVHDSENSSQVKDKQSNNQFLRNIYNPYSSENQNRFQNNTSLSSNYLSTENLHKNEGSTKSFCADSTLSFPICTYSKFRAEMNFDKSYWWWSPKRQGSWWWLWWCKNYEIINKQNFLSHAANTSSIDGTSSTKTGITEISNRKVESNITETVTPFNKISNITTSTFEADSVITVEPNTVTEIHINMSGQPNFKVLSEENIIEDFTINLKSSPNIKDTSVKYNENESKFKQEVFFHYPSVLSGKNVKKWPFIRSKQVVSTVKILPWYFPPYSFYRTGLQGTSNY